jgi:hypothetical protein
MDIIGQNTVCVLLAGNLEFWTRSGTTWTNDQSIAYVGTPGGMALGGNICCYFNATDVYIFERTTLGSSYTLISTINSAVTGITTDGTLVIISIANNPLKCYHNVSGSYVQSGSNTANPGGISSNLACASQYLVCGNYPVSSIQLFKLDNTYDDDATIDLNGMYLDIDKNLYLKSFVGDTIINRDFHVEGSIIVNEIIVKATYPGFVQPPFPASTNIYQNVLRHTMQIFITGGSITAIKINTVATGLTSGSFILQHDHTISITYTGSPTWVWMYAD